MFCVSKKKKSNKKLSPPKDFSCKYQKLLDIFKNLKVIGLLNLENLKKYPVFQKKNYRNFIEFGLPCRQWTPTES